MMPAALCGVVNDEVAIYFLDATPKFRSWATPAAAFVARWCAGSEVEVSEGAFRVRDDAPARRVVAGPHRTI
jgi:hypothetical protein